MSRLRVAALALVSAATSVGFVDGGLARADTPVPGDTCTVLNATTADVNGRTMWCNATMTGDHSLVWQYGGPA